MTYGKLLTLMILPLLLIPAYAQESEEQNQFSQQKIQVKPGDTITVDNDDGISHSVVSGKEMHGSDNSFSPDGRISTGIINPGDSADITFNDQGFYRLYDPDYPWMRMTVYVFLENPNNNARITIPMVTQPVQPTIPEPMESKASEIQATNQVQIVDNDMLIENIQLQNENTNLLNENIKLKIDNEKLQNQTTAQQTEIINLQNIVHEQIRVIMETLMALKDNS